MHSFFEEPPTVLIVRLLIKAEIPAVHQVVSKRLLLWHACGQLLHSGCQLLIFDPIVLIVFVPSV